MKKLTGAISALLAVLILAAASGCGAKTVPENIDIKAMRPRHTSRPSGKENSSVRTNIIRDEPRPCRSWAQIVQKVMYQTTFHKTAQKGGGDCPPSFRCHHF